MELLELGHAAAKLHRARSELLDAYCEIELEICRLLRLAAVTADKRPLGQKVEQLKSAKASPSYSKANRQAVNAILDTLMPYLDARADIVHGKLVVVTFAKGDERAAFRNPAHQNYFGDVLRILTCEQFQQLTQSCQKVARDLRKCATPASSPQRPSQGAGGAP